MKQPNIIYILSDQHNPEVIGFAGDPYVQTPNIDRLAAQGVSLRNCYCAAPLCVPSRSAILSGQRPGHTGVYNNMQALSSDKATFVNALTVGGYETVLSGRMHFVGNDQRHGFEKRFVGDITPSMIGGDNETEIYGAFRRSSGQNTTSLEKSGAGWSAVLDFDKEVTDAACDYISTRKDERPLFLCVGLYGPHCPYIAPPDLYTRYFDLMPDPEEVTDIYRAAMHPAIRQWYANRNIESVSRETVKRVRAAYYGMITYMDALVGRILETAGASLDMENTLIIYGSDHGDNIGKHGLFWKTNFYEGAARVPMIFSWPGVLPQNTTVEGVTSLLDLAPTLLELANAPELPSYDGCDLMPYLQGKTIPADRAVISECSDIKGDNPSAMLRTGSYKLTLHAGYDRPQLFDLQNDPGEYHDLAEDPGYSTLARILTAQLREQWDSQIAQQELERAKQNVRLMSGWFDIVKPAPIEEWCGDNSRNYLL